MVWYDTRYCAVTVASSTHMLSGMVWENPSKYVSAASGEEPRSSESSIPEARAQAEVTQRIGVRRELLIRWGFSYFGGVT